MISNPNASVAVAGAPLVENESESGQSPATRYRRVASIDLVRGLAMVFMALDHTRDYITNYPFPPTDLNRTWLFLFLVRWVTHFCAPAFFLLTGVGAYLYGRKHTPGELRSFLLVRGLWLVVLECTVVGFGWSFRPGWFIFGVICCLGLSMIFLAGLARLPRYAMMALALVVIFTHDLFDRIQPAGFPTHQWLLFLLHHGGPVVIGNSTLFVYFPLIPWLVVPLLGYSLGPLFTDGAAANRRTLLLAGAGALALFAVLRLTNLYGNPIATYAFTSPGDWRPQASLAKTLILFLDVEKYPAALDYLLMTLGTVLILLATGASVVKGLPRRVLETFGRVPLFFYLLHIYLIHLLAALIAWVTHQPGGWLFEGGIPFGEPPATYGHGIGFACLVWAAVIFILYWPCAWFARVKSAHPHSLLRFL